MSVSSSLRGALNGDTTENVFDVPEDNDTDVPETIILSQQQTYQIAMSVILGILILAQLALMLSFFIHRSKRVLEFAQPLVMNICNAAGVAITSACYLYLFISDAGCALRESIIFISLTIMGATLAGRAWRISILFSPMMNLRSSNPHVEQQNQAWVETARQSILRFLRGATGRESILLGRTSRLYVQITIHRILWAISLLIFPQLLLQVLVVSIPATRPRPQISYFYDSDGVKIGRLQCQSEVGRTWLLAFSIAFASIPYCLAWLLNLRPKAELDKLPEMVDERANLKNSCWVCIGVLITSAPMIGMSMSPNAHTYAIICTVISIPLSLGYFVAYNKLTAVNANAASKRADIGIGKDGRNSVAYAVRMAEMYVKIGRVEETVQLVEETLNIWRKGSGNKTTVFGPRDENEEVGSGFTKSDVESLEPEELELIIQLLKIKGKTQITLYGHQMGSAMYAKLHVDILKIFELCPASVKLKDPSIIFPVYNYLGLQIRGGAFQQDDTFSLELDLAERFYYEAQVQSFHLARALANLADVYGRTGHCEEAFKYFDIMQSIYMHAEHGARLTETYAVDRCAVCIATSALWYLQLGQIDKAIDQCDYVAEYVMPIFDKKDTIGLYHIVTAIIRVLKWNGHVDRARELYELYIPAGTEHHFAVGAVHKPMLLLLKICEESSEKYSVEDADIALALDFEINDFSDNIMMSDGWSLNSLGAELCLHLARRLQPGETTREKLVKKGIQLSSIADTRVKASNGMIKHILAYEAHKDVYLDLLKLAGLDASASRRSVHDMGKGRRRLSIQDASVWDLKAPTTTKREKDTIVKRLVLKDETSGSANGSGCGLGSSASADSTTDRAGKKTVCGLPQMSHFTGRGPNSSLVLESICSEQSEKT